jgi:hypothetical protein
MGSSVKEGARCARGAADQQEGAARGHSAERLIQPAARVPRQEHRAHQSPEVLHAGRPCGDAEMALGVCLWGLGL